MGGDEYVCEQDGGEFAENISEPDTGGANEALERALARAAEKVEDYDSRLRGARVNWSQDWEKTFNHEFRERLKGFIAATKNGHERCISG